jgi:hypothetical protein
LCCDSLNLQPSSKVLDRKTIFDYIQMEKFST